MKKIILFLVVVLASLSVHSEKRFCLGWTGTIQYSDNFGFTMEPTIGIEFNDRWALGTGVGGGMSRVGEENIGFFLVEPYLRGTVWHNELLFIDLKADAGWGWAPSMIDKKLLMFQGGVIPSLRFRLSEHWDFSADVGMFGIRKSNEETKPLIGISSCGVWATYRF